MKANKFTINDIIEFRSKVIENPFNEKMTTFYRNSVLTEQDETFADIPFDSELTKKLTNDIGEFLYNNNCKFAVCAVPTVKRFYMDDENVRSDEINTTVTKFDYTTDEHLKSVLTHLFANKELLLHSVYVIDGETKQVNLRFIETNKPYLDVTNLSTLDIEEIHDLSDIDNTKYGSKVPDFGNYSINKMKEAVVNAGYNEIIYNENKYKEINDNE